MLLLLPCCRLWGWAGRSARPTWTPCVPWPHKEGGTEGGSDAAWVGLGLPWPPPHPLLRAECEACWGGGGVEAKFTLADISGEPPLPTQLRHLHPSQHLHTPGPKGLKHAAPAPSYKPPALSACSPHVQPVPAIIVQDSGVGEGKPAPPGRRGPVRARPLAPGPTRSPAQLHASEEGACAHTPGRPGDPTWASIQL